MLGGILEVKFMFVHLYKHRKDAQNITDIVHMTKSLPAMQETQVRSLGQEDSLEKGNVTHSNILAWGILWTEEPGGLQFTGSQRAGHD